MRKRFALLIAGSAAALVIPMAASPAAAYEAASSCDLQLFGGSAIPDAGRVIASWNWASDNQLTSVHLQVKDSRKDGLTPAVRLVTKQRDGDTHNWSLHKNTGGSGTTADWNTTATDSQGIEFAWVQGELLDGSTLVGLCQGAKIRNPD